MEKSRMSQIFLALAISSLFLTFSLSSAAACNAADKPAMEAFRNHFPANTFPFSWYAQSDCCSWDGVGCDDKTGRVTSLLFTSDQYDPDNLPSNLVGTIPPSIGSLTALQSISLQSFPSLVGTLPAQMANLVNLQYFTIYNCSISGPLPSFLGNWTPLIELEINRCGKLSGSIPSSLGNLANLISIDLDTDNLSGTIPSTLFSKLGKGKQAELVLSNNKLTGPVPQSFASINWRNIDLSNNQLCGQIPSGGNYTSFNGGPFDNNKCLCGSPLPACK